MNQPLQPGSLADVPWPTSDHRMRVADTSMLPPTEAPQPKTESLRPPRGEWLEGARTTVRQRPLAWVAAAVALGAAIARLTR